jgi:hypothetical protein
MALNQIERAFIHSLAERAALRACVVALFAQVPSEKRKSVIASINLLRRAENDGLRAQVTGEEQAATVEGMFDRTMEVLMQPLVQPHPPGDTSR